MVRKQWEPYEHCSNCRNCVVYLGPDKAEMARCTKEYGPDKPLEQVIRASYGRGWKQAKSCADYESMD